MFHGPCGSLVPMLKMSKWLLYLFILQEPLVTTFVCQSDSLLWLTYTCKVYATRKSVSTPLTVHVTCKARKRKILITHAEYPLQIHSLTNALDLLRIPKPSVQTDFGFSFYCTGLEELSTSFRQVSFGIIPSPDPENHAVLCACARSRAMPRTDTRKATMCQAGSFGDGKRKWRHETDCDFFSSREKIISLENQKVASPPKALEDNSLESGPPRAHDQRFLYLLGSRSVPLGPHLRPHDQNTSKK